jgi:nitrite reductase (NADH) small subunit
MIQMEETAADGVERRWIRVARCESIPPREGRSALINGKEIAIFNLGDRFLAVDNRCPHQAGPLCDGIVAGDAVVCPLHAWKVNLETGIVMRPVNQNDCVRTYEIRVEGGVISIEA